MAISAWRIGITVAGVMNKQRYIFTQSEVKLAAKVCTDFFCLENSDTDSLVGP